MTKAREGPKSVNPKKEIASFLVMTTVFKSLKTKKRAYRQAKQSTQNRHAEFSSAPI